MKRIFVVPILTLSWAVVQAQAPSSPAGQRRDKSLSTTELAQRVDVIAKKALATSGCGDIDSCGPGR